MVALLAGLLLAAGPRDAFAGEGPLEKARQLLLAGKTDEAAEKLADASERAESLGDVDPVELAVLSGLIQQQRGQHREATWTFRTVLDDHPERVSIHLYLGQSLYALGDLEAAHRELLAGEGVGERLAGYFVLRATVEQGLLRPHPAFRTLEDGLERFPGNPDLLAQQALVLIRLGLVEAAREPAREVLEASPDDVYAYLLLAEAHRDTRQVEEAILVLEEAALRFSGDPEVLSRLAYCYALAERPLTSARIYIRAHAVRPTFSFEIAEQLRVGGQHRQALAFNALVDDEGQKLPQRLAIYLGMERYDLAAGLAPLLMALPEVEDITRYQLAYASYLAGDHETVGRLCAAVSDPVLKEEIDKLMGTGLLEPAEEIPKGGP